MQPVTLEDIFVNLVIVKEEEQRKQEQEKLSKAQWDSLKGEEYCLGLHHTDEDIPKSKQPITLKDLFKIRKILKPAKDNILQSASSSSAQSNLPQLIEIIKEPKKLLLLGRAGIGKSTLCQYLCYQSANPDSEKRLLVEFAWVFHIELKRLVNDFPKEHSATKTISQILFCYYWKGFNLSEEDSQSLWNAIQAEGKPILFLLDGYDEVAHLQHPLVEEVLLAQPYYLLTSRPYAVQTIQKKLKTEESEVLENIGLLPSDIRLYIDKYFTGRYPNLDAKEQLNIWLDKQVTIRSMCAIPIYLELLCNIWVSAEGQQLRDQSLINSTDLYEKMVDKLIKNMLIKIGHQAESLENNAWRERTESILVYIFLGRLALAGLRQDNKQLIIEHHVFQDCYDKLREEVFTFPENSKDIASSNFVSSGAKGTELKHGLKRLIDNEQQLPIHEMDLMGKLLAAGFLKNIDSSKGRINNSCYFLHLSFQEYFAALNLSQNLEAYENFIVEFKYDSSWQLVWIFVAGLLRNQKEKEKEKLKLYLSLLQNKEGQDKEGCDLLEDYELGLLISCYEEAFNPECFEIWQPILNRICGYSDKLYLWHKKNNDLTIRQQFFVKSLNQTRNFYKQSNLWGELKKDLAVENRESLSWSQTSIFVSACDFIRGEKIEVFSQDIIDLLITCSTHKDRVINYSAREVLGKIQLPNALNEQVTVHQATSSQLELSEEIENHLNDDDMKVRIISIEKIKDLDLISENIIVALVNNLKNEELRKTVLSTISNLVEKDKIDRDFTQATLSSLITIKKLSKKLLDTEWSVRQNAIELFIDLGEALVDKSLLERLIEKLASDSLEEQQSAALIINALGKIGAIDELEPIISNSKLLCKLLADVGSKKLKMCEASAEAVGRLLALTYSDFHESVKNVVRSLRENLHIEWGAKEIISDAQGIHRILYTMYSNRSYRYLHQEQLFIIIVGQFGTNISRRILRKLIANLGNIRQKVRTAAQITIRQLIMQRNNSNILQALIEILEDKLDHNNWAERVLAMEVISNCNEPISTSFNIKNLFTKLIQNLESNDWRICAAAIAAASALLKQVIKINNSRSVLQNDLTSLSIINTIAQEIVNNLTKHLLHSKYLIRKKAALALSGFNTTLITEEQAEPLLRALVENLRYRNVTSRVRGKLFDIMPNSKVVNLILFSLYAVFYMFVTALWQGLNVVLGQYFQQDASLIISIQTISCFIYVIWAGSNSDLFFSRHKESWEVQMAVIQALGNLASMVNVDLEKKFEIIQNLSKCLEHENAELRHHTIDTLGKIHVAQFSRLDIGCKLVKLQMLVKLKKIVAAQDKSNHVLELIATLPLEAAFKEWASSFDIITNLTVVPMLVLIALCSNATIQVVYNQEKSNFGLIIYSSQENYYRTVKKDIELDRFQADILKEWIPKHVNFIRQGNWSKAFSSPVAPLYDRLRDNCRRFFANQSPEEHELTQVAVVNNRRFIC